MKRDAVLSQATMWTNLEWQKPDAKGHMRCDSIYMKGTPHLPQTHPKAI
jgi:hypothetical protein